jgi:galactitol-specific phosphotransferase system IIB component
VTVRIRQRPILKSFFLKDLLDDILNESEVPAAVKKRLMTSAKRYLLAKDLGVLFTKKSSTSIADIITTITTNKSTYTKKPKNDEQT